MKKLYKKTLIFSPTKDWPTPIAYYTFDEKYHCINILAQYRKQRIQAAIQEKLSFKLVFKCPHRYYQYVGPCLNGVLTRQMHVWKKCFLKTFKKSHRCKRRALIPRQRWKKIIQNKWYKKHFELHSKMVN